MKFIQTQTVSDKKLRETSELNLFPLLWLLGKFLENYAGDLQPRIQSESTDN